MGNYIYNAAKQKESARDCSFLLTRLVLWPEDGDYADRFGVSDWQCNAIPPDEVETLTLRPR
jgi:hypothetical protein